MQKDKITYSVIGGGSDQGAEVIFASSAGFQGKPSAYKKRSSPWGNVGMRYLLTIVLAILGTGQSFAQDINAGSVGAGVVSCAEFAQKYQQAPQSIEAEVFTWAQGYMTALNKPMPAPKNLRGWHLERQKQHIRAFCDKRPLARVRDAVDDLFTNLPERR